MKSIFRILFFLLILLLQFSCDSVGPNSNNNGIDTTSHNFTFQTWTFGEHSSSTLNDVAIINDSSIFAVGEIYMNDSLGQPDPIAYNAAYWNGNEWTLQKITVKFRGNMITAPLEGVCAFSNTDIWFVGSLPIHGDGINWIMYDLRTTLDPNISVSKAWGTSSNDIYFVGRSGSVAHYSNTNWQKIESGTELNIYDIYGQKKTNGEYEIICVASDLFLNQGKKILNIENNNVSTIPDVGLSNSLHTVWFVPGKRYFIGGDGLFSTSSLSENWKRHTELPSYYKDAVRGNSSNDIIVIGAFGLLLHYNGNGWKNFQDITYVNGELGRVDINGNVVCAVGYDDNKAIIFIGKRN